jgi:hypothetical protein
MHHAAVVAPGMPASSLATIPKFGRWGGAFLKPPFKGPFDKASVGLQKRVFEGEARLRPCQ